MFDYHTHSDFSGDCDTPMEEMITAAISKGIKELCFTEHLDYDYPNTDYNLLIEHDAYLPLFCSLRDKYKAAIELKLGIEIGMQPHLYDKYNEYLDRFPFDFVLCSTHTVDGQDLHNGDFFKARTPQAAVERYYEDVLKAVKDFQNYDVYGHINFVDRYTNYYDAKAVDYCAIRELIDEILRQIIKNNKGIEVNTSGVRYGMDASLPGVSILKRYRELGGSIITTGSDAHYGSHIGYGFKDTYEMLRSIGFKYVAVFKKRNIDFKNI